MSKMGDAWRAARLIMKGTLSLQDVQGWEVLGAGSSTAGVPVGAETPLKISAAWSAIRLISETIGTLPMNVYKRTGTGGSEVDHGHPLQALLHEQPNLYTTAVELQEAIGVSLCCYGQAYVVPQILGPKSGRVGSLTAIPKTAVSARVIEGAPQYSVTINGQTSKLTYDQIVPIKGWGGAGQLEGFAPYVLQRDAIGMTKAAEDYGAAFFSGGGRPTGLLLGDKWPDQEKTKELLKLVDDAKGDTLVMGGNYSYEQTSGTPNENQFVETREFQIAEVARIWRVPLTMLMQEGAATYNNTYEQNLHFLQYTLRPYLVRISMALTISLLSRADRRDHYVGFDVESLLVGDLKTRGEWYRNMRWIGAMTINEIRGRENMAEIPDDQGGNDVLLPLNMAPPDLHREVLEDDDNA